MNTNYIVNHMANRHHTNVRCLDGANVPLTTVTALASMQDYLLFHPDAMSELLANDPEGMPRITSIDNNWYYVTIPTPEASYILGPIRFFSHVAVRHTLTPNCTNVPWNELPVIEFYALTQDVLLFRNLFYDNVITDLEFIRYNCEQADRNVERNYYDLLFENRENNRIHNSYNQEERMLESIENGDLDLLEKCRAETLIGEFGTMAASLDRSTRNVCIAAVTLVSRAAIRGGLNPELAFSLCDSYVVEIEQVKNLMELQPLVESAKTKFATMVHDLKIHKNRTKNFSGIPS